MPKKKDLSAAVTIEAVVACALARACFTAFSMQANTELSFPFGRINPHLHFSCCKPVTSPQLGHESKRQIGAPLSDSFLNRSNASPSFGKASCSSKTLVSKLSSCSTSKNRSRPNLWKYSECNREASSYVLAHTLASFHVSKKTFGCKEKFSTTSRATKAHVVVHLRSLPLWK